MRRALTFTAWVVVFAMFGFGVWAVTRPEPDSRAAKVPHTPPRAEVVLPTTTTTTQAPQVVVVPQVRNVAAPPTTTTTQPPTCLVFLVDRCIEVSVG